MGPLSRFTLIPFLGFSFLTQAAPAPDLALADPAPGENLALARYIASLREPDPFGAGIVAVLIEAWSPRLHQESHVLMLRHTNPFGRSEYAVLENQGELGATLDLILPYLEEAESLEDLPLSSRAITPANYRFHYEGMVETEGAPACRFRISPKQKRHGLIRGQIWIDPETGMVIAQSGYAVKTAYAPLRRMEISQDTKLVDGLPALRVSHVTIETREAGRGLLTITERRVPDEPDGEGPPSHRETPIPGGLLVQAH